MLILFLTLFSIVVGFYVAVLLHEWGHGTVAWILGYKATPFDVRYGGWFLQSVDEAVPYDQIVAAGDGVGAAMIGVAGVTVSIFLFVLSVIALRKIQRGWLYSMVYWFAIWNMLPTIQYLTVQAFSAQGDTGRFIIDLNISSWWVVAPGILYVCVALYIILRKLIPKAYVTIPIQGIWPKRIFLFISLAIMFWMIYTNAYNPLVDVGMPLIAKIFAILLLLAVPIIMYVCDPHEKA